MLVFVEGHWNAPVRQAVNHAIHCGAWLVRGWLGVVERRTVGGRRWRVEALRVLRACPPPAVPLPSAQLPAAQVNKHWALRACTMSDGKERSWVGHLLQLASAALLAGGVAYALNQAGNKIGGSISRSITASASTWPPTRWDASWSQSSSCPTLRRGLWTSPTAAGPGPSGALRYQVSGRTEAVAAPATAACMPQGVIFCPLRPMQMSSSTVCCCRRSRKPVLSDTCATKVAATAAAPPTLPSKQVPAAMAALLSMPHP